MLKALIVDDEKLVRSELRQLVNWSKHQIQIIGEAENGHAALRFLSEHEVDLMISDLAMPGLSGIEFLKAVRDQFPQVRIVVMTMHQNFELIQQAMRIGAVDYITKTQIEKENLDDILQNILKRLAAVPGEECCVTDRVTILLGLVPEALSGSPAFRRLSEGIWLGPAEMDHTPHKNVLILHVSGVFGMPFRQLTVQTEKYIHTDLFYYYNPNTQIYHYDISKETHSILKKRDEAASLLMGTDWLMDASLYTEILEHIPRLHMNPDELTVFLYQPYLACAAYLNLEPAEYFTETSGFSWWYQWQDWLSGLRSRTADCLCPKNSSSYAIQKAICYIDQHFTEDITLAQLLQMTVMSKSRFCYFFKERTGKTFVNYVKHLRVERAKMLLNDTDQTVSWVGDQVGYQDERYFRRVFRECSKCTPAQYRRTK
jgi:two-component system response regulator YesN